MVNPSNSTIFSGFVFRVSLRGSVGGVVLWDFRAVMVAALMDSSISLLSMTVARTFHLCRSGFCSMGVWLCRVFSVGVAVLSGLGEGDVSVVVLVVVAVGIDSAGRDVEFALTVFRELPNESPAKLPPERLRIRLSMVLMRFLIRWTGCRFISCFVLEGLIVWLTKKYSRISPCKVKFVIKLDYESLCNRQGINNRGLSRLCSFWNNPSL